MILVCSENTLCMISIVLNLLGFALCPRIWFIWIYVPCGHEDNVFSAVVRTINVMRILLIGGYYEVFLVDFLSSSINCSEADVEISKNNCNLFV